MQLSQLYPTHVPLNAVSRLVLTVGSAAAAIMDPRRGDMVAAMGESSATPMILEGIRSRMAEDKTGARILREKPRISNATINRSYLKSLPDGTLGKAYSDFLEDLNTTPDARPQVKYVDRVDHLYVMQRYRETHDFTHIALQMKTNMLGEVAVKYFEGIQLGLPMAVTGSVFGGARLLTKCELLEKILPWITEQAKNSRLFISYDWENQFEKQLTEVQKDLGIVPYLA